MYEEVVEKKEKPGKEWKLFSVTTLAVLAMVFAIALFVGGYMYYSSFRTFAGDFSQTTNVNYRKGGATVTTAEESFALSRENIYYIYNAIINAGRGRLGEAPSREPDAVLEYAFGGKLELWEIKLEDDAKEKHGPYNPIREYGLFIRYSGMNGYEYAYDTDRMTLDRLPLTARQNKE